MDAAQLLAVNRMVTQVAGSSSA